MVRDDATKSILQVSNRTDPHWIPDTTIKNPLQAGPMSVEEEFRNRGITRGGILMLEALEALAMVHRATDLGVGVLGVDGFWITDSTTQPDLRHSIDVSDGRGSWSDVVRFIEERRDLGLRFEVVLDE